MDDETREMLFFIMDVWKSLEMLRAFGYKSLVFVVGVAQLVEPWIVIPAVAGSSPVAHPIYIMRS